MPAPFKRTLDIYTGQWFRNGPTKKTRRGAKEQVESAEAAFLAGPRADRVLNAKGSKLPEVLDALSREEREVVRNALKAAEERRFFHWELEFPEVFYAPRSGTERVVERLDGAGFDAVIGNPPFDELSEASLGRPLDEISFLKGHGTYFSAGSGRLNWYHFFILRAATMVRSHGGRQSFIVPMSLLADQFTRSLRSWMLEKNRLIRVEAFPQKDDPERRVFREAKLPTCLYVLEPGSAPRSFFVRVHSAGEIEDNSPSYQSTLDTVALLDPGNLSIHLVSENGWQIVQRIFNNDLLGRMRDFGATPTSGEIIFNAAFRPYLTGSPTGTLILRGSHVQRYEMVEDAKQGVPVYLRKDEYLRHAAPDSKAFDFQKTRVVYQECAAIDNWRRVIAAFLPAGNVCGHKICYFKDYKCDPLALLGIFNSRLIDWLVTMVSSNNSLPAYLVGALPFPKLQVSRPNEPAHTSLVALYEKALQRVEKEPFRSARRIAVELFPEFEAMSRADANNWLNCYGQTTAFFAGEMVSMNQIRGNQIKRFLRVFTERLGKSWLDSRESLPGKTILKNFLGDYQKGESHKTFDDLWRVVERNAAKLDGKPLQQTHDTLSDEYDRSLANLLPLKTRLAVTDALIDLFVYRMYGLSEEDATMLGDTNSLISRSC